MAEISLGCRARTWAALMAVMRGRHPYCTLYGVRIREGCVASWAEMKETLQ